MPAECAACGHLNRAGARFCAECGAGIGPRCASCGAELAGGAKFCDACGAPVAGDGAIERVDGARKTVSVLFTDLAGSTTMQEALDPESVRRVMARFYEVMRATVEQHGGTVEKFIGDAVVAAFGTQTVREDDAIRAVRCAAEMVSALEHLNDELDRTWGVRLAMRTGVNTGELVVSSEGIMVGDTMNTAARLEQAAPAGQVLIGESTWRLVRHQVTGEEVEPLELKGKAGRVRAWRLVCTLPAARDAGDLQAVEVPLVGRTGELARLGAALQEAIDAQACRLVAIIGSPGLGKSRLAAEFAARAGERAAIVQGYCEPSGEGNTFLPVAEVVRDVAGIGEADPPDVVREKLRAMNPDDPARDRLVEATAGVLGVTQPASAQETFWALRRGLEVLARERPLVMVLDDLHWAQPMLLDLIEHLVEWIRDAPVLLVVLARPELREVREALTIPGRRATDVIELQALQPGESRALVDGLLGEAELPDDLLARILETTEGNPLFLGELMRMLVDEQALVQTGAGWQVAGGADAIDVPPTIQALLAARIERLRADERAVVERAAVIGKQFYRGAVAELLAPALRTAIDGHLEALRRKEMVEPEGIYWIDEPVYRFHHVLIRDAAYRLLLKEARAVLHERFADWLEAKAGDLVGGTAGEAGAHEEVIAFHLERSHSYLRELGPIDEAGRALGRRAAEHLFAAGRRALAREDLAAAENLLSRALECGDGDRPDVLWDLAEAVLTAGDVSAAAGVVERYRMAVEDDALGHGRATVIAGQLANLTGDEDPAATAEAVSAAAAALGELRDHAGEAKAWAVAAQANARLGRVGEVETALDRALTAARVADDRRRTTAVLAAAPRAALWGPSSVVRSSGRCLDVVRILRMTPGNRHVEALALRCQAVLEAMRGRAQAAREILAGARATLEELGLTLELHETQVYAGMVELLADDPAAAAEQFRAALTGFQSLGAEAAAAHAAAQLARALAATGEAATEALAQAEFAGEHGGEDLRTGIIAASARAEALAQIGDFDSAIGAARVAAALSGPTDALADKGDAAMSLARVLLAAGRPDDAREAARAALASYEAKGHTVGREQAQRVLGAAPAQVRTAARPSAASLGDRPPERFYAWFAERFASKDIEAMVERCAPGYTLVDRRATVSQETLHGREDFRRHAESILVMPDARLESHDVLACDERVIALRYVLRGRAGKIGGEVEVPAGEVSVVQDGRLRSVDMYDYEDVTAMLARYAELGGGLAALGDRPPERWFAEFAPRLARQEMEPVLEMISEEATLIDRRQLAWEPVNGREGFISLMESVFAVGHTWLEADEVIACDERVAAYRCTYRGRTFADGSAWEMPLGVVAVTEKGVQVRCEYFAADDREAMLARFAELAAVRGAATPMRPPERMVRADARNYATHDAGVFAAQFAEDFLLVDHRPIGWGTISGRDGIRESAAAAFAGSSDIRFDVDEVLACDDRVIAAIVAYRGHADDGGGEFELPYGYVALYEHGLAQRADVYDPAERQAMIARYTELGGGLSVLGDTPPERLWAEFALRFARQEIESLLELFSEEYVLVDHRTIGWEPTRGHEGVRALTTTGWASSEDIRAEAVEVLAVDERVIAFVLRWVGHANPDLGGGEGIVDAGEVGVIEDGRFVRTEYFAAEDRDRMLARFAALTECGEESGVS